MRSNDCIPPSPPPTLDALLAYVKTVLESTPGTPGCRRAKSDRPGAGLEYLPRASLRSTPTRRRTLRRHTAPNRTGNTVAVSSLPRGRQEAMNLGDRYILNLRKPSRTIFSFFDGYRTIVVPLFRPCFLVGIVVVNVNCYSPDYTIAKKKH